MQNSSTPQTDAFIFKIEIFKREYGFAEKPVGYLAHPKDAWGLKCEIMAAGPSRHSIDFHVDGIKIYESPDMKEGEAMFFRK